MSAPLDGLRVPGEEDARRRAWAVAQAALEERAPQRGARRHRVPRRPALAAAGALVLLALALTLSAPGRATAEWVRERIAAVAEHPADRARRPAVEVPGSGPLPGGGRILVVGAHGPVVLGLGPPRQLLGAVDAATWSPHGRFVAAVRGIELIAVDLHGQRRWSLAHRRAIRWPAWSPSGFRVAYVTGATGAGGQTVRVVAGDGTGDRVLATTASTPPAWQPGVRGERLATVDAAGRIALRDADSGAVLWRTGARQRPIQLAWSSDGRRLLALEPDRTRIFSGATGALLLDGRRTTRSRNAAVAFRPGSHAYALVRWLRGRRDARLVVVHLDRGAARIVDASTVLFAGSRIRSAAWSPRGEWLVASVDGAPSWEVLRLRGRGTDRVRLLAPGRGARLAGWCCG